MKNKKTLLLSSIIFEMGVAAPAVVACANYREPYWNKSQVNMNISKPSYASLKIIGENGSGVITAIPTSPNPGITVTISKKVHLSNNDEVLITFSNGSNSNIKINGKDKEVFKFTIFGLANPASKIKNVIVNKPTYTSLGIIGESGTAKLTTPPSDNADYAVTVNKKNNISNRDEIIITYRAKNAHIRLNNKSTIQFKFTVQGLTETQSLTNIVVAKPNITLTGANGSGTFALPQLAHMTVTASQSNKLSNKDNFKITVTAKAGYTINGKNSVSFDYVVSGLVDPVTNLSITKPAITFTGVNGSGTFVLPVEAHTTITADKKTNLSNNETIILTITAESNYTVNGKASVKFNYNVTGLVVTAKSIAPTIIKTSIENFKSVINVKEEEQNGQNKIVAWFGKDISKSPIVITSNFIKHNKANIENAPTVDAPFFNAKEMKKFIDFFLKKMVHGPELPTLGVIALDNKNLLKQIPDAAGFMSEDGLTRFKKDVIYFRPEVDSKSVISIDTSLVANEFASKEDKIDFNNFDSKIDAIYNTLQHEYGHNMSNYQTIQKPVYTEKHLTAHPDEMYKAGIYNGYRNNADVQGNYISSYYVNELAKAWGVDLKDSKNSKETVLTDLLEEKERVKSKNGDETDINKKLALWNFRVLLGDFNDKYMDILNRNKAFLYPGQKVDENFELKFMKYFMQDKKFKTFNTIVMNDYSAGYDEMLTRVFTELTNIEKSDVLGQTIFRNVLTGLDPYSTFKKGVINFSDQLVAPTGGINIKNILVNNKLTNKYKKNGSSLEIATSFQDSDNFFKNKSLRTPLTNTKRRDALINFYKNIVMGYNKKISTFARQQLSFHKSISAAEKANPWSVNVIGGWTTKLHQYIVFNDSNVPDQMIKGDTLGFKINDGMGNISFRATGKETWRNRSLNNTKKAWYVDFSQRTNGTLDILEKKLFEKKMSFWDDYNSDGIMQKTEITPINWIDVRNLYPKSNKVFISGTNTQRWGATLGNRGQSWTSGGWDIEHPTTIEKLDQGVAFGKEKF